MNHAIAFRRLGLGSKVALLTLAATIFAGSSRAQTGGPSFDCSKAGTPTEHAICASDTLASLDRALAEAYAAQRRQISGEARTAFADQQRDWLQQRNSCGDDPSCLENAMRSRLTVLTAGSTDQAAGAVILALQPYSDVNVGPITLRTHAFELEGGVMLPVRQVADDVYQLLQPVRGILPNGREFCSDTLITYLTLHRWKKGLYVLNAGDWSAAPSTPSPDDLNIPNACMMATYERE